MVFFYGFVTKKGIKRRKDFDPKFSLIYLRQFQSLFVFKLSMMIFLSIDLEITCNSVEENHSFHYYSWSVWRIIDTQTPVAIDYSQCHVDNTI